MSTGTYPEYDLFGEIDSGNSSNAANASPPRPPPADIPRNDTAVPAPAPDEDIVDTDTCNSVAHSDASTSSTIVDYSSRSDYSSQLIEFVKDADGKYHTKIPPWDLPDGARRLILHARDQGDDLSTMPPPPPRDPSRPLRAFDVNMSLNLLPSTIASGRNPLSIPTPVEASSPHRHQQQLQQQQCSKQQDVSPRLDTNRLEQQKSLPMDDPPLVQEDCVTQVENAKPSVTTSPPPPVHGRRWRRRRRRPRGRRLNIPVSLRPSERQAPMNDDNDIHVDPLDIGEILYQQKSAHPLFDEVIDLYKQCLRQSGFPSIREFSHEVVTAIIRLGEEDDSGKLSRNLLECLMCPTTWLQSNDVGYDDRFCQVQAGLRVILSSKLGGFLSLHRHVVATNASQTRYCQKLLSLHPQEVLEKEVATLLSLMAIQLGPNRRSDFVEAVASLFPDISNTTMVKNIQKYLDLDSYSEDVEESATL